MKFRTEMDVPIANSPLNHKDDILYLGSCFAQEMGGRFEKTLWSAITNPLGISYHPLALFRQLKWILDNRVELSRPWFEVEGRHRHYDLHSSMSRTTQEEAEQNLQDQVALSHKAIKRAQAVVLTLGTSWIYRLKKDGGWVNNNHKQESSKFDLEVSSSTEIIEKGMETFARCKKINPSIQIILTVSPIRHIRHGLVENNRSKSILIQAAHAWCEQMDNVHYFPSYEIMMDDLRDYRFYAADMVHPNTTAVDYIYEKFNAAWVSKGSQELLGEIEAILRFEQHRPFNVLAGAHQKALKRFQQRKSALVQRYPYLKEKGWS